LVFDDELSPSSKKISKIITECKILDRTHLILDILRNVPKLLCENTGRTGAMHLYAASMSGLWTHLERQGGIGMRGPGNRDRNGPTYCTRPNRFLKDKIKAIDKWERSVAIVAQWFVWLW
jgi:GTP-binding protein HflX